MHLTRHPLKSAPLTLANMPWPPRRAVPGRDTCTGRCETSGGCDCVRGFPNTVATDYGAPADMHDDTEAGQIDSAPSLLASLVGPVAAVAVIAAAVLAIFS